VYDGSDKNITHQGHGNTSPQPGLCEHVSNNLDYSIAALSSNDGLKVSVSCVFCIVAVITFMVVAFRVVAFMVADICGCLAG